MKDRTSALIVTATTALSLLIVLVAVAVLLVEQHTVPAVAIGLVTTLAAFLAPSPLGAHGMGDTVGAVLAGVAAAGTSVAVTAGSGPSVDLTQPEAPASPTAALGTPASVTIEPTAGGLPLTGA